MDRLPVYVWVAESRINPGMFAAPSLADTTNCAFPSRIWAVKLAQYYHTFNECEEWCECLNTDTRSAESLDKFMPSLQPLVLSMHCDIPTATIQSQQ